VHGAESEEEALKVVQEIGGRVNIVITDLGLPGQIDGCELIERVLAQKSDIRVVLMTGYSRGKLVNRLPKEGCVHVINRPFSVSDVLTLIDRGGN